MGCGSSTRQEKDTKEPESIPKFDPSTETKANTQEVWLSCSKSLKTDVNCNALEKAFASFPDVLKTLVDEKTPIIYLLKHLKEEECTEEISWDQFNENLHDKTSLESLFARLDTNHDETITAQELKKGLENEPLLLQMLKDSHVPMKHVMEYFEDAEEHITLKRFREILHEPSLEALFERADVNHDGKLSQAELADALKNDHHLCEDMEGAGMKIEKIIETLQREHQNECTLEQLREIIHDPEHYHNVEPEETDE